MPANRLFALILSLTVLILRAQAQAPDIATLRAQAESGNPEAQYYLGLCYYNGRGVDHNDFIAVQWLRKAAEQDISDAQAFLGGCYILGNGIPKDYTEGLKWFRKAVAKDNALAKMGLGSCYEDGLGVTKSIPTAMYWYKKAAEAGLQEALDRYNELYDQGYRAATSPGNGRSSKKSSAGKRKR